MTRLCTIAILGLSLTLGGCASWSCAGWDKGEPSRKDTPDTKAWFLKHNNFGRAQGCWK